ncbi:MAG: hypothetical protein KatS3mg124_2412 [Porticoccaceae bacterium]|nr:MAG: hypothetical protein KatS3mg124_2412 [Porticoccaceae bacterium]
MAEVRLEPPADGRALIRGIPLREEEGVGALTFGGYLREVRERFGPREAACIRTPEGVVRWSYDELWERALEVARALVAVGVDKGSRVGILCTNRLEFLSSFFGAALAGAVATPLSTFSTATELGAILEKACCSVLLLERRVLKKDFAAILAELEPQVEKARPGTFASRRFPYLRHLARLDGDEGFGAIEGWSDFLARGRAVADEAVCGRAERVLPADPGALFFSSGSTGTPKGILSSHRGVCLQLWRWPRWFDVREPVRTWSANGFFWSGNFGMALGSTLSTGGTLVLQRYFEPVEALELMAAERVSMLHAWPHQWAQLVAAPNWRDVDLSALRYIDRDSPVAQHPTVETDWRQPYAAYGNTETFTIVSIFPAGTPDEIAAGSHGVPTPGSLIKIVDPDTGETLRVGERGEIAVKGPTLMLGYVGVPLDETLDDEGFFHTGDGGYIDERGRLVWEGRISDIIKTGGANVSPVEVDEVLARCPGVKAVKTVGVPDPLLGELVVACIVPQEGATLEEAQVQAFAKQHLASFKVPRRVLFLREDEVQTTATNKIVAAEVRKLAAARLAAERRAAGD